jgi:hypothetical protein
MLYSMAKCHADFLLLLVPVLVVVSSIRPVTLWILNLYLEAIGWESVDQIVLTHGMVGSCEHRIEYKLEDFKHGKHEL